MNTDWKKAEQETLDVIALAYNRRLDAADSNFRHLEDKAKWTLALALTIGSALSAFLASGGVAGVCAVMAGAALAASFFACAALAGASILTTGYMVPVRIPDELDEWRMLIEGEAAERKLFWAAQLGAMHRAVKRNEIANDRKAGWLKRSIVVGLLGAPIAAAVLSACFVALLVAVPAGICPAIIGL